MFGIGSFCCDEGSCRLDAGFPFQRNQHVRARCFVAPQHPTFTRCLVVVCPVSPVFFGSVYLPLASDSCSSPSCRLCLPWGVSSPGVEHRLAVTGGSRRRCWPAQWVALGSNVTRFTFFEIGTMSVLRLRSRERVATISLFSRLLHQALQPL